jgi:hypothetical protein
MAELFLTVDGKERLRILERFRPDEELPKYKKDTRIDEEMQDDTMASVGIMINPYTKRYRYSLMDDVGPDITRAVSSPLRKILRRFVLWILDPGPRMSIAKFFSSVKDTAEQIKIVEGRAHGYTNALAQAKKTGQTALHEQLAMGLVAVRAETQLLAIGLGKYLSEESLIAFIKKAKKGLRLDNVGNFTRLIPDTITKIKTEADGRGIFDGYAVLHYDPTGKSWAETQKEKATKVDPILFGIILGRRRLYFVGDWVDDTCDLTLDQIADTIGKDQVGQVTNEKFD